jgi:hypothetical protein
LQQLPFRRRRDNGAYDVCNGCLKTGSPDGESASGQKRKSRARTWGPEADVATPKFVPVANPPVIRDHSGRLGGKLDMVESGRVH